MDIDEARALLRTQHRAVLATRHRDGTPAMTPVIVGLDDAGRAVISSRQTAYKVKNLRRDPRAWLCVLPDAFFGRWISLAGGAEIVDLPAAMDGLIDYYRRISGEHPDWDDYRAAMERERRVLIRVTVERAGPDVAG
ncbi:PPOX class F420-dependent oxidoreductase [Rhizomonospora bruguierae]|uniref:PPOX class F420-dependent oxidoreductase n=1 Tax=Rhizomonospora bruguierae TaxID=1581705 RepID=UPI0020C14806|nr:PPOX class F420-dependent oxidoreductase [Micromonospora sp. NBRC 107566]